MYFKFKINQVILKKYDIGISYMDGNFTDLLFLTNKIKKRFSWVHSSYATNPNAINSYQSKNYRNKLIKNRYQKLDAIYFVSENSKDEFINVFGSYQKMEVVYNMIGNENIIKKSMRNLKFPKTKFRFVAIGSLYKVKGYDKLITACKLLKNRGYNFELLIAGQGYEEDNLKAMVTDFGLKEFIHFTGFLSNPYPLLKSSDVFIMTSISEALPTVLCEALILGKPTLVTNCSGCKEIINYGEFGLMAEQTPKSIAENMQKYIESEKAIDFFKRKSFERSSIFSDKIVLEKYYKIFNS